MNNFKEGLHLPFGNYQKIVMTTILGRVNVNTITVVQKISTMP
jgi:hypothetical protein